MPSLKIKTPLVVDRYFHIYNRGNNKERIFEGKEDYQMFLRKYTELIHPYVNTYAFCLLPNHFHFLLKIEKIDPGLWNGQPSHMFRKFFQAYAIWFNNRRNRRGSLFTKYYRRIEVTSDEYLKSLIYYIHHNPVKHGVNKDFQTYPYSSYKSYLNYEETIVSRNETLSLFDNDLVEFIKFHHSFEEKPDLEKFFLDET